tara:strand:+ start:539 stop:883 length:345 start_codon:yes stop_codon:yes gene_type:complete
MGLTLPIYRDFNDYFAVRTKTISRIAIADIMDNSMLLRWYSKILDSYLLVKDLKGFGYFESDFSHGYLQATFRFNKLALEVIQFQFNLRGLNKRNTREISIIEATMKEVPKLNK